MASLNVSFGLTNLWDISLFMTQIVLTSALLGILFEFPLVMTGLIRLGVFDISLLVAHRRLAYALIFIIVSLLPPTDGLSLIIMSVPMVALYELTILFNRYRRRGRVVEGFIN
jgi:sec-independent protein translocase protein TatC